MFVRPKFPPKLVEQLAPGQVLGHYRIAQKIGEGGMGEVYRARDEHLGRDVAIKVLPTGTLADPHARKRFRKEADALSKLNHPNIATIYDFDTQEGVDFLVMEYIPGETLSDKLCQQPLSEKEVVRLGLQLVEGLAAAHEQGVIHRDLKPGNLRLTTDERLKILDFGLARLVRCLSPMDDTESSLDTVVFAGTLPYMAPEQLRGAAGDVRSDIYSAGVVLYELATGRLPFPEKLATALADDILHQAPPPPGRLRPELSPRLEEIILKCLEKDPENRYQSAKELAIDLRRLVAPSADPQQVWPSDLERLKRDTDSSKSAVLLTLKRPIIVIPVATAVLLIAAVLFAVDTGGLRSTLLSRFAAQPQIRSLAVLPLANLSGDPQQEYFADGMTEELITELSRITSLKIISRTSVIQYKGEKKKPLAQIARELRVDAVMESSVLRSAIGYASRPT